MALPAAPGYGSAADCARFAYNYLKRPKTFLRLPAYIERIGVFLGTAKFKALKVKAL
jgi:hypothetical protein